MPREVLTDLDFQGAARVRGILAPLSPQDAANKAYVDASSGGGSGLLVDSNGQPLVTDGGDVVLAG